jgi:hypothetical protein
MPTRRVRSPDEQRAKEARAVVDLLNDAEQSVAAVGLGLAQDANADAVADALVRLPRADTLRALVGAAPEVIEMLKDIAGWLDQHGISARTTGFTLSIDGLADDTGISLSAQEVAVTCSWPNRLSKARQDSFARLLVEWRAIAHHWAALVSQASPRQTRVSIDPVKSAIARQAVMKLPRDRADATARVALSHLAERLNRTIAVVERMPASSRTGDVQRLLVQLNRAAKAAGTALSAGTRFKATRGPAVEQALRRYSALDQRLATFQEDVYASAVLSEAMTQDLFQLHLWRNRPQLYEVWVLVSLLRWLETLGYSVKPLEVTKKPGERSRWHLSYAKASKPCAMVHDGGKASYVFFQLFRSSSDNGPADMPDIALLDGPSPRDRAIWAVDPKHSARAAYRLGDYRSTGARYATRFGAKLAAVVEYYPREDLPGGNPHQLDDRALLVKDASPHGKGMQMLLDQIGTFHPAVPRTVLCVDMSASFDSKRASALEDARSRFATSNPPLRDVFVWFAGGACHASGATAFASGAELPEPPELDRGTSLQALVAILKPLIRPGIDRIVVVGDGEFHDRSWRATIAETLDVVVDHQP